MENIQSQELPGAEKRFVPSAFASAFEKQRGKLGNWIEQNNEAIFDAFVGRVVKILHDNPGMTLFEFLPLLQPTIGPTPLR